MLIHNLADAVRAFHQAKRDINREQAIEEALHNSSARLAASLADSAPDAGKELGQCAWLTPCNSSPTASGTPWCARHWHGWTVARIAQHLDCSNEAVAGLLKRGLKQLRDLLQGWE
jgi:DNA-directed RNA polymerase specialized sigma24 family protein